MKLVRFAASLAIALSAPAAGNAAPSPPGHQTGSQPSRGEALASAERMARWQLGALPRPGADGGALPANLDPALAQFIRNESAANPRSWHQGVFWLGMSRLADRSGAPWVKETILAHGRSQHWRLGERAYNTDDHLIGMTYLWASRNGEGGRALAPLRATFDSILQAPPRRRCSHSHLLAESRGAGCQPRPSAPTPCAAGPPSSERSAPTARSAGCRRRETVPALRTRAVPNSTRLAHFYWLPRPSTI